MIRCIFNWTAILKFSHKDTDEIKILSGKDNIFTFIKHWPYKSGKYAPKSFISWRSHGRKMPHASCQLQITGNILTQTSPGEGKPLPH